MVRPFLERATVARKWLGTGRAFVRATRFRMAYRDVRVALVCDGASWIVDSMAYALHRHLYPIIPIRMVEAENAYLLQHKVIHTLSNWFYFNVDGIRVFHPSNKIVTLWSWGNSQGTSSNPGVQKLIPHIKEMSQDVAFIHVPCTMARDFLLSIGVKQDKVVWVPQGVDLDVFHPPPSFSERLACKRKLGIPEDRLCIGLFHKDGQGWGEGNEPKLPKGPDVFVKTLAHVAERTPVVALIPGPARGYVKRELQEHGIPVKADGWVSQRELLSYYYAADVYLIPSREEGGPAGLLEAMATGTPVVSTRCGMALDLILHEENGFLAELEDAEALAYYAWELARKPALWNQFSEAGLRTIQAYDWRIVARQHLEQLYLPLLHL